MKKDTLKIKNYYYSFNGYLRERFGCRVHRLSLNAGFFCPNLDGSLSNKGCVFCNNKAFSRFAKNHRFSLEDQIRQSIAYARNRYGAQKYIAYFQSFSNTYAGIEELKAKYSVVRKFKDIVGIAISTRPDCIDREKIKLISSFSSDYEVYLEYGLQSAHDRSLKAINRNHSFKDFRNALDLANSSGIKVGVHVILGLPGETKEDMMATAGAISELDLWGIKFHCLHVVKNTELARIYNDSSQKLELLSPSEYVDILIGFLTRIPPHWVILRLVSGADKQTLIAPSWVNEKQKILKMIQEEMRKRGARQGVIFEKKRNAAMI
ncbi:MAG: TIGR01212 family radical SAM protein [Candidatus Omnitrophica bacterium]|nr:TIGR01212 family radical SAM protein [Candidatus Omnitrophota bacterium]MBD3268553.1 TIGR01212 family radical SAM protein [Candidatus Omnitrophota bacterium]